MAFTPEQLNFFKFSSVVLDEFPVALRQVFVDMWDTLVASPLGFPKWDDSVTVLNILLAKEGFTPSLNKSFKEWDCTALFKATLFAQTFATPDGTGVTSTLHRLYVKPLALTDGTFHHSFISPSGLLAETYALALDQLRLLRNVLCHQSSTKGIDTATFNHYITLAKDAFTALGQSNKRLDEIGNLGEDDFPTVRLQQLEDELKREQDAAIKFKQIFDHLNAIESQAGDVKTQVTEVKTAVDDFGSVLKDIHSKMQVSKNFRLHSVEEKQTNSEKGTSLPESRVPDKIPHFVGRQDECNAILDRLTDGITRFVGVWGPPGFGKTSVAINVAHHLREMNIPVFFTSLRGIGNKNDLVSKLLCIFTDVKLVAQISPTHLLFQSLRQFQGPFVLILDNADVLRESGDDERKEEFVRFIEELVAQCDPIKLLVTSCESLDCLTLKFAMHHERINMLDESASGALVRHLLPTISDDDRSSVVKVCGQVPLTIRLMCSNMTEANVSISEFLNELEVSPLVEVLDNERYSDDLRLKVVVKKSFQRLTPLEKDVFVSLAVFPGIFEMKDALAVLEFQTEMKAKKVIGSLKSKALLDFDDSFSRFTMHSIFRSFVEEQKSHEEEINALFSAAKFRFYDYYISLFGMANEKFLIGDCNEAFLDFYGRRECIISSLTYGTTEDELCPKVIQILSTSELFLYGVLRNREQLFHKVYDSALEKVRKRQDVEERKLLASKSFSYWGWFSAKHQTWEHSLQELCSHPDCPAKARCYHAMHQILCGQLDEGISSLRDSVFLLGGGCDEEVLKLLVYIVLEELHKGREETDLASYYDYLFESSESKAKRAFSAFGNSDFKVCTLSFAVVVLRLMRLVVDDLTPVYGEMNFTCLESGCTSSCVSVALKERIGNLILHGKFLKEDDEETGFSELDEIGRDLSGVLDIFDEVPEFSHILEGLLEIDAEEDEDDDEEEGKEEEEKETEDGVEDNEEGEKDDYEDEKEEDNNDHDDDDDGDNDDDVNDSHRRLPFFRRIFRRRPRK